MSEPTEMTPAKVMPSLTLRETLADQKALATVFLESGLMKSAQSQAQAIVFMMAGAEMGLQPYESMNAFDIIEGRVSMRANTRAAQVKRSGKYNYKVVESTESVCRIKWYERQGTAWEEIGESSFTIEQAQKAGLTGKKNWQGYASDMLFARALSRGQRQHCPEVTGGSRYLDPDEVDDEVASEAPAAPAEGSLADISAKVKAKVKPEAAAPVEEPQEAEFREIEEPKAAAQQKPKTEKAATSPVKAPVAPEPPAEPVDPLADDEPQAQPQEQASIVSSDDPNRLVMSDGAVLDSLRTTMEFFGLDATHELYFQRLKPPSLRMVADLMDEIGMSKIKAVDAIAKARSAKIATWGEFVDVTIDLIRKAEDAPEPAATPERDMSADHEAIRASLEPIFREEGMEPTACEWLVEQEANPVQLAYYIAHLRSQGVDATGRILLHAEAGSTLSDAFEADAFEAVQ